MKQKRTVKKVSTNQSWFYEKIKNDIPLARLTKKKMRIYKLKNISNE